MLVDQSVESSVIENSTLLDQADVLTPNGIFHDSSEGDGLVVLLSVLLNARDQFHRVVAQADAELLRSIGLVLCHWKGAWVVDSCGGDHQNQQHGKRCSGIGHCLWFDLYRRHLKCQSIQHLVLNGAGGSAPVIARGTKHSLPLWC